MHHHIQSKSEATPLLFCVVVRALRVQLFSTPQHIVAPSTSSDPHEKENPSAVSSIRSMLDSVISAMAAHKQVALAEQVRLKEQAAKEQESKAKSIKDKQQPKDNTNKKSKS